MIPLTDWLVLGATGILWLAVLALPNVISRWIEMRTSEVTFGLNRETRGGRWTMILSREILRILAGGLLVSNHLLANHERNCRGVELSALYCAYGYWHRFCDPRGVAAVRRASQEPTRLCLRGNSVRIGRLSSNNAQPGRHGFASTAHWRHGVGLPDDPRNGQLQEESPRSSGKSPVEKLSGRLANSDGGYLTAAGRGPERWAGEFLGLVLLEPLRAPASALRRLGSSPALT